MKTIRNTLVIVDSRESVIIETGDIATPIKHGLITPRHIHAEIGEIPTLKNTDVPLRINLYFSNPAEFRYRMP